MKKAGIRYACAGMLLMGVILTGIVCGVDAVEGSRQESFSPEKKKEIYEALAKAQLEL